MKNLSWQSYAILCLVIFSLFFFAYYKPKNKEFKNLRVERIKIEQDVIKSLAKKLELDKIEAELKNLDNTLTDLESIIPQKKEISEILRRIQQFAFDSQLNIRKFAPQGEISKEFFSEWPIKIEMTGTYHKLGIFFDQLSRFSRIFTIDNFSIKSLSSQSPVATISASCTAKTYIFHEEVQEKEASRNKIRGQK